MKNIVEKINEYKNYNKILKDCTDWKLLNECINNKTKFYCGIDPTGPSLHLGHLIPLTVAKILSSLGMKPIILLGGFTAMIGDPSGKSNERNLISQKEVKKNAEKINEQIKKLLPKCIVLNNNEWLEKLSLSEFFREFGKYIPVASMVNKEQIKNRINTVGISFTEFSYMILQAIDFYILSSKYNCPLQIGGSDQWGNIVEGVELIRKKNLKNTPISQCGLTFNLMLKEDGTKFGKTSNGTLWLEESLTNSYTVYQYLYNLDDLTATNFLKFFCFYSKEETETIIEKALANKKDRIIQQALAKEIISWIHGAEAYKNAQIISNFFFSDLSHMDFKAIDWNLLIKEIGFKKLTKGNLSLSLVNAQIVGSRREFNELVNQKALKINNIVVESDLPISAFAYCYKNYSVLSKGKKEKIIISY